MAESHEIVELGNRVRNCSASHSSSSVYHSTRMEGLLQSKSNYETALDFQIAASKDHWSELQQPLSVVEESSGGEKGKTHLTDGEIVLSLQRQFPQMGFNIRDIGDYVELGKKIAEGAQAEIFEAIETDYPITPLVLKVFKEGLSVLDLQKQWSLEMLNRVTDGVSLQYRRVTFGTVVMNGRFAFMMFRFTGDLRTLIDKRMERNSNRFCAPFSDGELKRNMYQIALGMKGLHKENIVHRDLKASNVLIEAYGIDGRSVKDLDSLPDSSYSCLVADYECSVGVVGTGFWRAPEILQAVKAHKITPDLFTKEADVYSFAMTCYEMVTGRLPFEAVEKNNYDVVLRGDRPTLPDETKPWIKTLLSSCWDQNPKERPNFEDIFKCIEFRIFGSFLR